MEPLESTVHEFTLVDPRDDSVGTVTITGVRTHLLPQFADAYSQADKLDVAKYLIASAIGKEKAEAIWDSGDQAEFDRQCRVRYDHLEYTIERYGISVDVQTANRPVHEAVDMIFAALEDAKTA